MLEFKNIFWDWLADNLWLLEVLYWTLITLFFFFAWGKLSKIVIKKTQETENKWDDILIKTANLPLVALIFSLGLNQIIAPILTLLSKDNPLHRIWNPIQDFAPLIIFFWLLFRLISGFEVHYRQKRFSVNNRPVDPNLMQMIFRVIKFFVILIAGLSIAESFGVSISGVLAFGGAGGIIVGIAAKDTLENFFASVVILWERPFSIGDWVRRPGTDIEGVVEHIGWRMTQIRTFDQRPIYIPNSHFVNNVIENPQRMTNRRIYEYMGLRYQDWRAMPLVLEDIRTMLKNHEEIEQTKTLIVCFDRYGPSTLDFFVYAITKTTDWIHFHKAKEDVLLKIAEIVEKHNCDFGFPTRTIHVQNDSPLSCPPPSLNAD